MSRLNTHRARGTRSLRRGRFSERHRIYHVTSCTHNRTAWFSEFSLGRVVVKSFAREDEAGHTRTLSFVVMPDHLHWLFELNGDRTLATSINTVKSYSARCINEIKFRSGPVWQVGYHDHAIRREEDVRDVARYIVANPIRAGLVRKFGDYPLWDAIWI